MSYPRIFCIGRNYVKHIEELNNEKPEYPVIFMKPFSSLVMPGEDIPYPRHGASLHHEVELVLRVGKSGRADNDNEALKMIDAFTVGIDLTLRDVQQRQKEKGLPWEIAKAFDGSSPVGEFYSFNPSETDLQNFDLELKVNGNVRQKGNTRLMIFSIPFIIRYISGIWNLMEGDLIYTGTPSGVSELAKGDEVSVRGNGAKEFTWRVSD